jgi:capsular polysaccharide biosynthesis protein
MKVENDGTIIQGGFSTPPYYDPYFIQTTFEIIQSQHVLSNVVANLNLNEIWGNKSFRGKELLMSESMEIIKSHLVLGKIRNTKLITITFISEDPNEAAQVANAIAESYRDYRIKALQRTVMTGLEAPQSHFQEEEGRILSLQTNLAALHQQLKIQDETPTNQIPEQQPYWSEKRKLENLVEEHKMIGSKIAAMESDKQLPTSMVQIVDRAVPPTSPITNRPLAVGAIVLGLLCSLGGWFLLKPSTTRSSLCTSP